MSDAPDGLNISPRVRRTVYLVGGVLVAVGAAVWITLLVQTALDPGSRADLDEVSAVSRRGGSVFATIVAVTSLAVILGAGLIGIADVARRRIAPVRRVESPGSRVARVQRPPARPLGIGWILLWMTGATVVAVVVCLVASAGAGAVTNQQLGMTVLLVIPGLAAAACVGALAVSGLRRADASRQRAARTRAEAAVDLRGETPRGIRLTFAIDRILGGMTAVLAWTALLVSLQGAAAAAIVFTALALASAVPTVVLTLRWWRTGQPLDHRDVEG